MKLVYQNIADEILNAAKQDSQFSIPNDMMSDLQTIIKMPTYILSGILRGINKSVEKTFEAKKITEFDAKKAGYSSVEEYKKKRNEEILTAVASEFFAVGSKHVIEKSLKDPIDFTDQNKSTEESYKDVLRFNKRIFAAAAVHKFMKNKKSTDEFVPYTVNIPQILVDAINETSEMYQELGQNFDKTLETTGPDETEKIKRIKMVLHMLKPENISRSIVDHILQTGIKNIAENMEETLHEAEEQAERFASEFQQRPN